MLPLSERMSVRPGYRAMDDADHCFFRVPLGRVLAVAITCRHEVLAGRATLGGKAIQLALLANWRYIHRHNQVPCTGPWLFFTAMLLADTKKY